MATPVPHEFMSLLASYPLETPPLTSHGPSLLNPLRGAYLPSQEFHLLEVLVSPTRLHAP